jgi:hypothetical protein
VVRQYDHLLVLESSVGALRPLPGSGQGQTASCAEAAHVLYGVQGVRSECRFSISWIEAPVPNPRVPESRTVMSELRLIPSHESIERAPAIAHERISEAERELNSFINSMTSLIGTSACRSLTELWLNELACMECIPGSESFNWRSVSLSASVKLAGRVIASHLSGSCF